MPKQSNPLLTHAGKSLPSIARTLAGQSIRTEAPCALSILVHKETFEESIGAGDSSTDKAERNLEDIIARYSAPAIDAQEHWNALNPDSLIDYKTGKLLEVTVWSTGHMCFENDDGELQSVRIM